MTVVREHITLSQIAAKAKVSRAAVGCVLLGTGKGKVRVGEETTKRILNVASKMNYKPNLSAQILAGKKSKVIGIIIDSEAPLSHFNYLSNIEKEMSNFGYRMMIGQMHNNIDLLQQYLVDFSSRGVDGIICISHDYPQYSDKLDKIFKNYYNKTVFISVPVNANNSFHVYSDACEGTRLTVKHLASRGRKRIANILNNSGTSSIAQRKNGYEKGMSDIGIALDDKLVFISSPAITKEEMSKVASDAVQQLVKEQKADAIIAINDIMAIHLVKELKRCDYKVPEDIAVIGSDNMEIGDIYEPSLTTLDKNAGKIAKEAFKMLKDLIEKGPESIIQNNIAVMPKLIIRETS